MYAVGVEFHGEFSSADASALNEASSRFALYGARSTSAITLASTDCVRITDIVFKSVAAINVDIYDGANNAVDAGELIARVAFAANTSAVVSFGAAHHCQVGTYPKVKASGAGQIDVVIHGFVGGT